MSWGSPSAWRNVFDDQHAVVQVFDEFGGLQAVAALDPDAPELQAPLPGWRTRIEHGVDARNRAGENAAPEPPPSSPDARPCLLDRVGAGLDRLNQNLQDVLDAGTRRAFATTHGGLPEGTTATVALPDGGIGSVVNGAKDGDRRVNRTGAIRLYRREYRVRHRSRRRTDVQRDGVTVATLRRKGWYWRAFRADEQPPRYRMRTDGPLELPDQLAVQLTAGLCGPPGRPGWLSRTFGSL